MDIQEKMARGVKLGTARRGASDFLIKHLLPLPPGEEKNKDAIHPCPVE
jgi:hypothetical protein